MIRHTFHRPRIRPSTTHSTVLLWCKSLLNALLFFGIFIFVLPWAMHWFLPGTLPLPAWLSVWGGGILAFVGISIWMYCLGIFSQQGRGTPLLIDAPRNLVSGGFFNVVRNPIMVAELLVIWAEVLYFVSFGILVYAFAISLVAHFLVVYVEEPELRERFGGEYESYCKRVPRWFPRFKKVGE